MHTTGPCEPGFQETEHNHDACIAQALARADRLCRERGAQLTAQRRRVLELVWRTHRPVGAYDLLAELRKEMRAEPPTVYRALEFLQQQGLIHRLASLNAFVGCSAPETPHGGYFLICQNCRSMQPLPQAEVASAIRRQAAVQGFAVSQEIVEILGTCATCRGTEGP